MKRLLFVAALLVAAAASAQTVTPVPVGANKILWDEGASSLAEAQGNVYRLYKDDGSGGSKVVVAICTAATAVSPAGTFPCSAPFPADTPGVQHKIQLTASLPDGTLESPPSTAFVYTFRVVAVTPANVRAGK